MKVAIAVTALFAAVQAQYYGAPPGSEASKMPPCGFQSCIVPYVSKANTCTLNGASMEALNSMKSCLCSKSDMKGAMMKCIQQKCSNKSDVTYYKKFANTQCTGQPGYPIAV